METWSSCFRRAWSVLCNDEVGKRLTMRPGCCSAILCRLISPDNRCSSSARGSSGAAGSEGSVVVTTVEVFATAALEISAVIAGLAEAVAAVDWFKG